MTLRSRILAAALPGLVALGLAAPAALAALPPAPPGDAPAPAAPAPAGDAAADDDDDGGGAPETTLDVEVPAYEPLDVDVNEIARAHAVRLTLGFSVPMHVGGLTVQDSEAVFEDAVVDGDSAVHGSGVIAYRRGLLDVRLGLSGKILSLVDGSSALVDDGVQRHLVTYDQGGGFFSLAALAGVTWEPSLYTAAGGNEGLTLTLTALGGLEHLSIWGSFRDERIPNYRHPERSFHWIVERQRFDGEIGLHWRHFVGGATVRHLLGIEAGVVGSLLVHVPGISYASDAVRGAKDVWGSWAIFVRLSWELGLPTD